MRRGVTSAVVFAVLAYSSALSAQTAPTRPREQSGTSLAPGELRAVSPALDRYQHDLILEGLWKRPGLSPRDRSMVTIASVIARNQPLEMAEQFTRALDNGVTPAELSEVITHLAFYAGWGNAMAAVSTAKDVFAMRNVTTDQLPAAKGELLPLDQSSEAQRHGRVVADFGSVSPGVVEYTRDLLFRELWLRPGLMPRDRSLVTVSALIAAGQVEQIPYHLNRAMDSGLTQDEASEALTHLAFYSGWPNVFSALPVAKGVFDKRPK
jgi:4-carboxymuconolactone decarboxylase